MTKIMKDLEVENIGFADGSVPGSHVLSAMVNPTVFLHIAMFSSRCLQSSKESRRFLH